VEPTCQAVRQWLTIKQTIVNKMHYPPRDLQFCIILQITAFPIQLAV